jgi:hypothetical protein
MARATYDDAEHVDATAKCSVKWDNYTSRVDVGGTKMRTRVGVWLVGVSH